MEISQLTARRPHLLRAFYSWLLENQLTPYLVADINVPGIRVPLEYAQDGQIILNIAPGAVGNLDLGNDEVRFNARFKGVPRQVIVPMAAVLAVYSRENGVGTMFEAEAAYDDSSATKQADVRDDKHETVMTVVDGDRPDNSAAGNDHNPDDDPPPRGGRPALRVVK